MRSIPDALAYAVDELRQNWSDQLWWRHRIGNRVIAPFHVNVHPRRDGSTYVTEADWDVLVVLDGCRADLFEEVVDTGRFDSYRRVESPGSKTPEWARENFGDDEFGDTVYVASNAQVSKALDPRFHATVDVWKRTDGVARPEDVSEAARAASRDYPDKRLVVHYLQPHRPFLSSDGRFTDGFSDNPWRALANGDADRDTLWDLYRENLEIVFEDAFEVARDLPGRAIVTSDHGNLLGERALPIPIRLYGHPGGVRHPALVEVPWAVVEADERPTIRTGTIEADVAPDEDLLESHLADLGYR